jgi:SAM-dependent methyltransferase
MSTQTQNQAAAWGAVARAWDANVEYIDDHCHEATSAVIDRLAIKGGQRVLELAAGPGTLGNTWSTLVGGRGRVVISDLAPPMVEVARARNAGLPPNVSCEVVDAESIPYGGESFDVVFCRMGLQFSPDPTAAVAEIRRVLSPGGRLGLMTWAAMEHNPWMSCVGMAAMMNGVATGGPPVGPGSIFSLGDEAGLVALVADAGFADVRSEPADIVVAAPDIDTHVTRISALAGPLAAVLQAASAEQRAGMLRTAADLAAPYRRGDGGYDIPGRVLTLTARC